VRLVLSLRTRDHVDLVDAHVAFHLAAGVDTIIATDHRSNDGTCAVLERYEREGSVVLVRNDAEEYTPGMLMDEAARLATVELGADWIIHSDADEFWWPRGGDLKEVLSAVPERFGVVRGVWRHFPPRPGEPSHFAERMTARLAVNGPWSDVSHTFHPHVKIAHRPAPEIVIEPGGHEARTDLKLLRGWYPFEILHFPIRTLEQARTKYEAWRPVLDRGVDVATHVDTAVDALREGRFGDFYAGYLVDDRRLEEGIRTGWLAVDTRLRDALRLLAGDVAVPLRPATRYSSIEGFPPSWFPTPDVAEQASLADDVSALADSLDRAAARIDLVERRLEALEWGGLAR
jgi:hypothetical protein